MCPRPASQTGSCLSSPSAAVFFAIFSFFRQQSSFQAEREPQADRRAPREREGTEESAARGRGKDSAHDKETAVDMSRGSSYDRHLTIFSPEGRLYQIEYAFKAVKSCGYTTIGVCGTDGVAFVTQLKAPDKLIDPASCSHIYSISPSVGMLTTG